MSSNTIIKRKKVFIALSGGVDSSTAAALLYRDGYDCSGVFMIANDNAIHAQRDAEEVAEKLKIKLHVLDLREDFEHILDYFFKEYKSGRTPNPCVFCNRYIKFGKLWDFAQNHGAQLLATGHYARIIRHNGDCGLYEGLDPAKEQSYVLSMIDRKMLNNIILPIGDFSKKQTRQMASEFNLGAEHKPESQEICFIPDDDYVSLLEQRCPELVHKGKIIDSSGKVLGEHSGVHRFTIGQRRGLKVAMGVPYYVTKIDAVNNTVTLGPKEEVLHNKLRAANINWLIDKPESPFRAKVRIRYNDKGKQAMVYPERNSVLVEFDEPNLAITPGQLAAIYIRQDDNSRLIGGGWIDKIMD